MAASLRVDFNVPIEMRDGVITRDGGCEGNDRRFDIIFSFAYLITLEIRS